MSQLQAAIRSPRQLEGAQDEITDSLTKRYGASAPSAPALWNEILAGLLAHRSTRAYLPDPLPAGTIEVAVAAAQSAASSSNLQLWSVVAVQDEARKARLADLAGGQAHIRQAPLLLVWLADLARADQIAEGRGGAKGNLDYLETFVVGAIDAALAAQNAVVALESLGLGTVYIGALRNQPEKVAAELGLPPLTAPVFGLVVGWPDPAVKTEVKPRLAQSAVMHRETYSLAQEGSALAVYDAALADFQQAQGLAPVGWSDSVVNRVGKVGALSGRERLRQALNTLGFPLK